MSRVIDERVVSLQFDNKHFERNVATSMSTIDKLKQSLNFKGVSKGLENIGTSVKKCNLAPLSSAADTVGLKFNAMYTIADQALRNIVNSATLAGKRIVSALTIDPVKTGFQEYETQINAVQTILANTQSKGTTLDDVNAALDELNTYADKTIYNFTEMTRNIGTFTAAGVDLDKSVTSIKGIANLAAISGSTSQQASTAMYQLSQALAAGTVKLMDWNSVVNAGMGGEVFQTALKRTATQMGYNVDQMIEKYGSFRESLTKGEWLTAEVLTETLTQLAGAYDRADLIQQGYTEKQADDILKLAKTAESAATDVKTFTQLLDTLKESAQSGWTQTWELLVGDFEEAKSLWSGVSETIGGFINKMSESRNEVLEGALNSNWKKLVKGINEAGVSTEEFEDKLRSVMEAGGHNVDKILKTFGSFEEAFRSGTISSKWLKEALDGLSKSVADFSGIDRLLKKGLSGDDVQKVQEALMSIGFDLGKFGADGIFGSVTEEAVRAFQELEGLKVDGVIGPETLKALEEATSSSVELKDSLYDLIDGVDQLGGREKLLQAFKNLWTALTKPIKAVGKAWNSVFGTSAEEKSAKLYNLIGAFESFTEKLIISGDSADQISRIFSGLFSALKLGAGFLGGGFKMAFNTLSSVLENFDLNILEVAAHVGDALTTFYNWVAEHNYLADAISFVAGMIMLGVSKVREWTDAFMALPGVQKIITNIGEAFSNIGDYFSGGIDKLQKFISLVKKFDIKTLFGDGDFSKNLRANLFKNFKTNVLGYFSNIGDKLGEAVTIIVGSLLLLKDSAVEYLGGAGEKFETFKTTMSDFMSMVKEKLGNSMGSILAFGSLIALVFTLNKIKDAVEVLAKPFDALDDFLGSLSNSIKKFAKAQAIKGIATSIAILAASVAVLAILDQKKVWSAVGAIIALGGGLVLMTKLMDKIDVKDIGKMTVAMAGLAGAFLLMSVATKILGGMNWKELLKGGSAIIVFVGLVAVMAKMSGTIGKGTVAFGKMMVQLAGALLILSIVAKIFGSMDTGALIQGSIAIMSFLLVTALMTKMTKGIGKNVVAFGSAMVRLGASLLLMAFAVKILGSMDTNKIVKGSTAIAVLLGMMVGMMAATKLLAKDLPSFGTAMTGISFGLLSMALAIKVLAGIDAGDIVKGSLVIASLLGMMVGMMAATKLLGKYSFNAGKMGVMMLAFSGSILLLTGAILALSMIDAGGLKRAVGAIATIGIIFTGLLAVTKIAKSLKVGTIVALSAAVGVLALSIAALSFIDGAKLASATTAISVVIGMFAVLAASTKLMSGDFKSMGMLVVLSGAVVVLAGIVYKLSELPVESTLSTATALSTLLLSLSASLALVGKIGSLKGIGGLAVMGLVVAELAIILGVMAHFNVAPSIETASSLSVLLLAMSGALAVCSLVGTMGPAPFVGMAALAAFIVGIGALIAGIGALVTKFPELETFVDTGIPLLEKIGNGLGSFFGNIVGGFTEGISGAFPTVADNLSSFMTNLKPFLDGASAIDESAVNGVGSLVGVLTSLTGASILDAIASWITGGGSSIVTFANNLVPFGESMVKFSSTVAGKINEEAVTAVANAGKVMAEMAAIIPNTGGVASWFAGDNTMDTFGTQLVSFGESMASFSSIISGNIDEGAVTAAANAGKVIAEMAAMIPNTGGMTTWFSGDNTMDTFGTQLVAFGTAMKNFSTEVSGIDETAVTSAGNAGKVMAEMAAMIPNTGGISSWFSGDNDMATFGAQLVLFGNYIKTFSSKVAGIDETSVTAAANAGSMMAEMANTIPDTGGMTSWFSGDNDMATFGTQLVAFGTAIKNFSTEVAGIDESAVTTAASAGSAMAEMAKNLPESGGLWSVFSADNDMSTFASEIKKFGSGISDFSTEVAGIDEGAVTTAISAGSRISLMAKNLPSGDTLSNMSDFSKNAKKLGKDLKDFADEVKDITVYKMSGAIDAIAKLASIDASGIEELGESLGKIGADGVNEFIDAFDSSKSKAADAATKMIEAVAKSVTDNGPTISDKLTSAVSKALSALKGEWSDFYDAGKYLVKGFASGISANSFRAEAAAKAMANAAYQAAKKALNINSPSRVFRNLGTSVPEGFAMGIEKLGGMVTRSSVSMAKTAIEGTKNAIARIADVVNSDIDAQPTIRPVVDLSNARAGAAMLNNLFDTRSSVGVMSHVNSISAMMGMSKNSGNGDVISAIEDLGRKIGNMSGNTYNVNGVTYDDGSNISNAVRTLVDGIRIERRR